MSYECNGLAFGNHDIYILEHPLLVVLEADVAELYLMFEAAYMYWFFRFLDVVLCQKYLVNTFHRGKTLGDVVSSLGEVLKRLND